MHPNHGHRNSIAPVHNSNNRLYNNTIFQNNQYTFSLNRSGEGYLESRPLSSASLYSGEGGRVSRGTKSDIGVPCRRQSSSKMQMHYKHMTNKSKIPSVKSDFLLSYLSNNSANSYSAHSNVSTSSAYHISTVGMASSAGSDYLENSKITTNNKYCYGTPYNSNNSTSLIDSRITNKQRNNNVNNCVFNSNSNLGPLLYLDSDKMNNRTRSNMKLNQAMQSVSRKYNA